MGRGVQDFTHEESVSSLQKASKRVAVYHVISIAFAGEITLGDLFSHVPNLILPNSCLPIT